MRYIIVAKNDRILRRKTFRKDPKDIGAVEIPQGATVVELTDEEADALDSQLEEMENGQLAKFNSDAKTVEVVRSVELVKNAPFKRQIRTVMLPIKVKDREAIINAIGPGYALDDTEAMLSALSDLDLTEATERVQLLKSDLITVISREITRRDGLQ